MLSQIGFSSSRVPETNRLGSNYSRYKHAPSQAPRPRPTIQGRERTVQSARSTKSKAMNLSNRARSTKNHGPRFITRHRVHIQQTRKVITNSIQESRSGRTLFQIPIQTCLSRSLTRTAEASVLNPGILHPHLQKNKIPAPEWHQPERHGSRNRPATPINYLS